MDAVHTLYVKAGARNFVLIDVPPVNLAPQGENFQLLYAYVELLIGYSQQWTQGLRTTLKSE